MEYKRLGKSGLKISELSFGAWVTFANQLDAQNARECMKLAYDAGVNFFDNAEVYAKGEAERMMGKIIKEFGWSRDSFCVSSKAFWGGEKPTQKGLSRKHLFDACHQALERLQMDYLDLFFCHRPDPETPISETVRAMNTLIDQGKVLYWGTSEWSGDEIEKAIAFATKNNLIPPTMEQPQYNLFHRHRMEVEYLPLFTTPHIQHYDMRFAHNDRTGDLTDNTGIHRL
jgi:voltage-dependent potassium channel beta subunit